MLKFSIIIPVYNSEKYLEQCVNSILKQDYTNFEIILIDDESTDSSAKICDEFTSKDARVITIHQKNGGTSAARNTGLNTCSSDYVMFMDNDDFWDSKTVLSDINKNLLESHADVLMYNTKEYWENTNSVTTPSVQCEREKIYNQNSNDALEYLISKGVYYRALWAKVIKKELLDKHNIYFAKGIRNEDTDFSAKLILYAKSYDWYDKIFYVYRKGTGTAQTNQKMKFSYIQDLSNIIAKYTDIAEHLSDEKLKMCMLSYLAYPYAVLLAQLQNDGSSEAKDKLIQMKKYLYILKYHLDPSVNKVYMVFRLLGFNMTCKLLGMYLKKI